MKKLYKIQKAKPVINCYLGKVTETYNLGETVDTAETKKEAIELLDKFNKSGDLYVINIVNR